MEPITPSGLQQQVVSTPDAQVIDVRSPVEYSEVHVPGARLLPLDSRAPRALFESGTLARDKPVYVLCRSGARATKAAEQFAKEGFDNAIVVKGGTLAWIEAGRPVNRGSSKVISLERQVRIGAGALVLTGTLLGWFVHRYFFGIPAFVGSGLVFAGITDWCGMGLLLAKAPWNQKV